jgi:glycosyltransferase involved in cell wall biosynthesis
MPKHRPRVLFLCHSASRNGATILLVELLGWLRSKVDWTIEIVVQDEGPLLENLRAVSDVVTVWRDPATTLQTVLRQSLPVLRDLVQSTVSRVTLPSGRFDLIYANTSATASMVRLVAGRTRALLWHVHELGYALRLTLRDPRDAAAFSSATRYIGVSVAVGAALQAKFGVPAGRIDVAHGFVPAAGIDACERHVRRKAWLSRLGWPPDAFVVGGCGTPGWRKGTDLFLQIARAAMARAGGRDLRFLWVGGQAAERESIEFEHDAQALGLAGDCRLVPVTGEVLDTFCAMDLFALTSREDPFPLVMLEAAELGLPTVCFAGSGGGPEFVAEGRGESVPYLDISAFVEQIIRLQSDLPSKQRMGELARQRVQDIHRVDVQGPRILRTMEICMSQARVAQGDTVHELD